MKEIRVNQIKGYENIKDQYKILSDGRCVNTANNKILSIKFDKDGYPQYQLITLDNKIKNVKIHRILAQWLIPNPNNLPMVRHLNDNKLDWRLENLAWGTRQDNIQDMIYNGNYVNGNKRCIKCIETNTIYESMSEASRALGICVSNISKCCYGEYRSAKELHFEFID